MKEETTPEEGDAFWSNVYNALEEGKELPQLD